jgi:hypothetical protein
MLSGIRTFVRLVRRFLSLPRCYVSLVNWKECARSRPGVASDLLYIFFRLRCFPDHYSPCRLDEKPREDWHWYYGSNYGPIPRERLQREVQPPGYRAIFNDKVLCEVVSRGLGVPLPRYLGELRPSDDCVARVTAMLAQESAPRKIIIKPVTGSAGRGIVAAYRDDSGIVVDTGKAVIPLSRYRPEEPAIVQEFVPQHPAISAIAPRPVNTIRVLTLCTRSGEILVLSSSMRFGVGSATVDNWSAGGVAVGVDHRTGRLMDTAWYKDGTRCHAHPDTGFRFEGFQVPFWDEVLALAKRVQRGLAFYRLIGIDVALTPAGPVLIEMNARPDFVFQEQTAGPLLRDPRVLQAFGEYGLLYNGPQRRLLRQHLRTAGAVTPAA